MEVQSFSARASAMQAQGWRQSEENGGIARRQAANARLAGQPGERVGLGRESRDLPVPAVDQRRRQDEMDRAVSDRILGSEQQDQARLRTANMPRSVTQALAASSRVSLI